MALALDPCMLCGQHLTAGCGKDFGVKRFAEQFDMLRTGNRRWHGVDETPLKWDRQLQPEAPCPLTDPANTGPT